MTARILIVDDNAFNRTVLSGMLRKEYEILEAGNGADALKILDQDYDSISAVLLDVSMPVMDGYEALRRIRSSVQYSSLPVIMITASGDEETMVKSLSLGANDFVAKPYSVEIIRHCLNNQITFQEAASTIDALQRDRLTGLYNREAFFVIAAEMIEHEPVGTLALDYADIDSFKLINDQYGSEMGDEILQSIAYKLDQYAHERQGICARMSDDNFIGLWPISADDANDLKSFDLEKSVLDATGIQIKLSAGRYVVVDKDLSVSSMYDRAKLAQESVKGRMDVRRAVYDESMMKRVMQVQEIVSDMHNALKARHFEVWFQPQHNHLTGNLVSAEALVRWRHPQKGLIPPNDFIPIFENNGFIYELDKYVWDEVCHCLRSWLDRGLEIVPISVNVSRHDVSHDDFLSVLDDLLEKYKLTSEYLHLEITESAFSKSTEEIVRVVEQLIAKGFTVEIDDFGSGLSSLNALKDVPAQVVKLDMRFFEKNQDTQRGGNIIESVVRMSKWLNMSVIAEGVEEKTQADFLASVGCFCIQGYYYSRPMPREAFEAYFQKMQKEKISKMIVPIVDFNNNTFWDPESMDTLIFNSYIGSACIFEYKNGLVEVLRVSQKFTRQFAKAGLGIEDAMRLGITHFLDEQDRARLDAAIHQSFETNEDVSLELILRGVPRFPERLYLIFQLRVIAVADPRYLVYCSYENITAQRESEMKEKETTFLMETVLQNISGGVVLTETIDEKSVFIFSNDRYFELLGYSRAEYQEKFANSLGPICQEDIPATLAVIKNVMSTGKQHEVNFRARHKDGRIIWLKDRMIRVNLDRYDRPVQLSVLYDISDQKENEDALRQSALELNLALEQSNTAISRLDIKNRVLEIPSQIAVERNFPTVVEDMPYGMLKLGKIHPDSQKVYIQFYKDIFAGKKTCSLVYQLKLGEDWRWFQANSTTIFSNQGEALRAVLSFHDITEQLEKESVYKRWQQSASERNPASYSLFRCNLNQNIAYAVEDGELLHGVFGDDFSDFDKQVRVYVDRLVYEEDKNEYLTMVNSSYLLAAYHRGKRKFSLDYRENTAGDYRWLRLTIELVEQVTNFDVEAYLLYEDIDQSKREELLVLQRAETDALTGLMNRKTYEDHFNQLSEARGTQGLSALMIIDLDGFKLVNDNFGHAVGDETLIEISEKLRENFRKEDILCRLGGDEFVVYMVDVAHINNIKDKAALICALLHKSFSLNIQLSASIGISICADELASFEVMYREADAALYYVKNTGKDNYAIYEPAMGDKSQTATMEPLAQPDSRVPQRLEPKRRMLIVDDNELNRNYLAGLFAEDFIVETAEEGTAALVRLKRYGMGISIVLLDLLMPGLDGFEVLRQMRESLSMQDIPVIVVSGMDETETCLRAIREGATDYVSKPIDGDLLKLRVASALNKAVNDQLRAQNRFLALQNQEVRRLAEAKRHSEELTIALHAAERADVAKTQFLSSMSHEIRTPLNALIGFNLMARNELMKIGAEAEDEQSHLKVLDVLTKSDVASKQLLTIINDVLDISAIEAGKIKVEDAPFDFRGLVTSLTVLFFSQARAKGVNFEVLFDKPVDEWFRGDQLRINQILTNLLSNAVKFTPEGGDVRLSITERQVTDESVSFRFVVSDTGIGMTEEYLKNIWMPFEQAESSISRRFGGSGLGLAITKNLVELMNGSISVESKSGVGSSFTVDLTFARTEQPELSELYDFANIRALVVDDDASTCSYVKLLFDHCGADCVTCTSGEEAISIFREAKRTDHPFTLCMVDWIMPEMDGFTTITEIRRVAPTDLPIIVVTAYDFADIADQVKQLGIIRFISKPLFQSTIFDMLSNINGQVPETVAENHPDANFDGVRVLLAEDNNMNMEVAKHVLTTANLAVDGAWSGQEAIDIFLASQKGTYKAILMDVHMPDVDGYTATRTIRASVHPDAQTVPIIAMTADAFAEDIAEAHAAGMNDHISKPIDQDKLYDLLSKYIRHKS